MHQLTIHKGKVEIDIYDVAGRRIKRLVSNMHEPGYYEISWSGTDSHNRKIGNGVYFCRMSTGTYTKTKKIIGLSQNRL